MGEELAALTAAIDALQALRPYEMTGDERRRAVVALEQQRTRLTAALLQVVAAFCAQADHLVDASRDAAGWIKSWTGSSRAAAAGEVRLARALRSMTATDAALAAGTITQEHARLLAGCAIQRTWTAFVAGEEMLVAIATTMNADDFATVIAKWKEAVDPDGAEPRPERPDELHATVTPTGRVLGKFSLSGDSAISFMEMLRAKTDELFQRDKKLHDVDPTDPLLASPASERRARALVELMERGTAASDPARRQPVFTVIVDQATLAGENAGLLAEHVTAYGVNVPRKVVDFWKCDSTIARLVMSADGVPLEMGREIRNRAQRRALRARDGGCAVPGCDAPPNWCDAHHVVWWERGGETGISNLVMLCRHHHVRIHEELLRVEMIDGRPRFFLPDGSPLREPERLAAA